MNNKKNSYKLKTVNGLRAVFSFTACVMILLVSFLINTHFDKILIKAAVILGINIVAIILAIRFCVGTLTVNHIENKLTFDWIRKPLLDFRKFREIEISRIDKIVIDQNQIIRKIHTDRDKIKLNTLRDNKIFKDDSMQFIKLIETIKRENHSIRFLDSWDEWNEKGYLKIAYWINTSIIAIGTLVFVIAWILIGFKSINMIYLIFLIPQLILYQMTMKSKMNR
ncbi:MAG: hypothetical protein H6536_04115 [Bacteroidales bacterium]|nr:hypothetical protein [Bacteroidales bacterium]